MGMYEKLKEYKGLLDEGILTEAEFEKKKREILGMPDKEEEQRIAEENRLKEIEHQKKIEEDKKREAEHKRKLEERESAERERKRKQEIEKLAEIEKQKKREEERKIEIEKKLKQKEEKHSERKGFGSKIILSVVIVIILILVFFITSQRTTVSQPKEAINWDEMVMGGMLPEPESLNGFINDNDDEELDVEVVNMDIAKFNAYIDECESMGYTIDAISDDDSFDAYNETGHRLSLYYNDGSSTMEISLEDPIAEDVITWSSSGVASLLPEPKSNVGEMDYESSDTIRVYLQDTTLDEFNDYIDDCMEAGFDVDYYRYDDSYSAENEDGVSLNIYYEANNIMQIHAYR